MNIYLQGSKDDADIKSRLVDIIGEGVGGMIWESSTETYIAVLCYAKSLQSCPTLCGPIGGSLPGYLPGSLPGRGSLPRPWDSPGKNTGVGCYFLLQCMIVKVKSLSRVRLLANQWTAAY